MQEKHTGLILRESDVGENDRIVTILTADSGLLRAFAKGSKKMKSKLFAGTRLFSFGDYLLYRGHDKYIVTDATRQGGFFARIDDIEKLALAQYICELTGAAIPQEQPDETGGCLRLVLNTLHVIENTDKPLPLVKAAFELRLMLLLGYGPDVSSCADCSRTDGAMRFYPADGVLLCPECASSGGETLSPAAVAAMRYVLSCDDKRLYSFTLPDLPLSELSRAAEQTVKTHMERTFKTLDFYHSLRL